jgi:hypothetical protein
MSTDNPKPAVIGFNKIKDHPDKEQIVERILAGDSVRVIEAWLKQKYPMNKNLQISFISLQSYRKNYLNLEGDVIKELQAQRQQLQVDRKYELQQDTIKQTHAYQAGLNNYVQSSLIDYNAEIMRLMNDIRDGIDKLKEMDQKKGSHLNHQAIAGYLDKYKAVIELHNKMIREQEKKQGAQLSEDYAILEQKLQILIDAVKDAFNQTNPDGLFVFMAIVKDKMRQAGLNL